MLLEVGVGKCCAIMKYWGAKAESDLTKTQNS